MGGFGGFLKGAGKVAGTAMTKGGEALSKSAGDEDGGSEKGIGAGRKIGEKAAGYLRKRLDKTKAKGGPMKPSNGKGDF